MCVKGRSKQDPACALTCRFCRIGLGEGHGAGPGHRAESKGEIARFVGWGKREADLIGGQGGVRTDTSICSIWGGAQELGQQDEEGGSKEKE